MDKNEVKEEEYGLPEKMANKLREKEGERERERGRRRMPECVYRKEYLWKTKKIRYHLA